MITIKPEQFEGLMTSILNKYEKDVVDRVVDSKLDNYGKNAKEEVQGYSKPNIQLYITGRYKKGWVLTHKKNKGLRQIKVYNKAKPTLVHLLEFGHGGPFPAKPYPHVSKTELKYMKLLYEELRRELQ